LKGPKIFLHHRHYQFENGHTFYFLGHFFYVIGSKVVQRKQRLI